MNVCYVRNHNGFMFSTQSPLELERIDLLTVSSHNEKYVLWQNGLDYKRELADELRLFKSALLFSWKRQCLSIKFWAFGSLQTPCYLQEKSSPIIIKRTSKKKGRKERSVVSPSQEAEQGKVPQFWLYLYSLYMLLSKFAVKHHTISGL